MDLLLLGSESRKTHLRPKKNLAKDKYDMEDIDEFFEDDNETVLERVKDQGEAEITKDNFNNVARKINFTDAEAESFNLSPISISSKFTTKNKKSPLRSPLLEHDKKEKEQGGNSSISNDNTSSFDRVEEVGFNDDFGNDFNDFNDIEDNIIPIDETAARDPVVEPHYNTKSPESIQNRRGSTLTKQMALASNKKPPKRRRRGRPAIIDDEDDSLDERDESPVQDETSELVSPPPSTKKRDTSFSGTPREVIYRPDALPSPPPDGLRRSKRTKVAPLAYWRNERIVYSRVNDNIEDPDTTLASDIKKVPLQEIKEVVHIPEISDATNQSKRKGRGRPKSTPPKRRKKEIYDYESDPEIDGSEWFKFKSLSIEVFENLDEEIKETRTVAWTSDGGEFEKPPSNDDGSSPAENFEVATLFNHNKDFSASGLLDFPFEGFKSLRNSGNCVFTFHVVKGLIEVSLNNEVFVVTRGCSFEIPSNNIYGFKNIGHDNARLFFVQSRVPSTDGEDGDTF